MNKGATGDYCECIQAPQQIRPPTENMWAASWKGTLYLG